MKSLHNMVILLIFLASIIIAIGKWYENEKQHRAQLEAEQTSASLENQCPRCVVTKINQVTKIGNHVFISIVDQSSTSSLNSGWIHHPDCSCCSSNTTQTLYLF